MARTLTELSITDTLGISSTVVIPVKSIVCVEGANGSGKTSVLDGFLYAVGGGSSPEVIHRVRCDSAAHGFADDWSENPSCEACKGRGFTEAERSVIAGKLSDGTTFQKVTRVKRARRGGEPNGYTTTLEITQEDGTPVPAPQTFIEQTFGTVNAINPARLLSYDVSTQPGRKALAAELMRLLPLAFEPEEMQKACSYRSAVEVKEADALASTGQPIDKPLDLDGLKKVSLAVTEQRRRAGIVRDDTDGSITRLQKSLPPGEQADRSAKLTELERELAETEGAVADSRKDFEVEQQQETAKADGALAEARATAELEYQTALAVITKKRSDANAAALEARNATVQAVNLKARQGLERIEKEAQPERDRIKTELATVKEQIRAFTQAVTLRAEIDKQLAKHREESWLYDQLSGVLQRIEELRLAKIKNPPVRGLLVENGDPTLDGIPWERCNLARKIEACIEICCLQAGEVRVLVVDNFEHADAQTQKMLEEGLVGSGWQIFKATVTNGPLRITVK